MAKETDNKGVLYTAYSFPSEAAMRECGKWWAERLGLGQGSGWCIVYRLCDELGPEDELGHNDCDFESKTSVITIYKHCNAAFRMHQEETLIHELLHCKCTIDYDTDDYESRRCAELQHQVLNDVARALFMVKYGLSAADYERLITKPQPKPKKKNGSKCGQAVISDGILASMF